MADTGKFVLGREKGRDLGQESQYWLRDRLQSPAGELGMALGEGCLERGHKATCPPCVLPRVLSPEPARLPCAPGTPPRAGAQLAAPLGTGCP